MKRFARYMLILGLVAMLALTACGNGGGEAEVSWVPYTSETLGVTLSMPEDWITEEEEGNLYVASSRQFMETDTLEAGAGVIITAAAKEELPGMEEPVEILEFFLEFFGAGGDSDVEVISEATSMTIEGQPAAKAVIEGTMEGQAGTYYMYTVVGEANIAIVIAVDADETVDYSETLERIATSIQL